MRRALLLAALLPLPALAEQRTTEVLVSTTATALPQLAYRRGMLVENRGPNPIYCGLSSAVTTATGHVVSASGGRFAFNGPQQWWCITTVLQVSGAATVVSEVSG